MTDVVHARTTAERIADGALEIAKREIVERVRAELPRLPPPRARVRVAAFGKGAASMARVAMELWRGRVERALVVVPDGAAVDGLEDATVLFASHPLPDARSVAAGRALLDLARELGPSDVLLVLLSGGASALACAPVPGFSVESERALVTRLLASGLGIADVNCVRGHLSMLKHGGLAVAAYPARTLTIVVSDVLGEGDLATVGGAPTIVGHDERERFVSLVRRVVPDEADALVALSDGRADRALTEDERASLARRTRAVRAAGPELLVDSALLAAGRAGHDAIVVAPMSRAVEDEADRLARFLLHARAGTIGIVHGEPTVTLPEHAGSGGRLGRLGLLVARAIDAVPGRAIALRASDGVDGTGGLSGMSCDETTWSSMGALGPTSIARYDDANAHRAHGRAQPAAASGMNLLDLGVLAVAS